MLAWTALVVALGASVAANVASARHETGPRLSAAVAPILVVLAAALLERVSLVVARQWQRCVWAGVLSLIVASAFVTSYEHQQSLLSHYGNPTLSADVLPIAVDALIIMASVALSVIATQRRQWRDSQRQLVATPNASDAAGRPPVPTPTNGHRVDFGPGTVAFAKSKPGSGTRIPGHIWPAPNAKPIEPTAAPRRSRNAANLADLRSAYFAKEKAADAAIRLGVSKRTVERTYAHLRETESDHV